MAHIMTKQGQQDNVITYEHICDSTADLASIPYDQSTLGSTAIVLVGESGGLEVYMANSNHEWILLTAGSGGGSIDIDLSQDTIDALHMIEGYTAHNSQGLPITGAIPQRSASDINSNGQTVTVSGGWYQNDVTVPITVSDTKQVNFIDYDGTVVYSYDKDEFLALDAMPANPTHSNLIAQGWNWDLDRAKTYVQKYEHLDIGQSYTTSSGATELLVVTEQPNTNLTLKLWFQGSISIDWGDSTTETGTSNAVNFSNTYTHTYAAAGEYTVKILSVNNTVIYIGDDSITEKELIRRVNIGNFTKLYGKVFYKFPDLQQISLPTTVSFESGNNSSIEYFAYCYGLKCLVLPKTITSIPRNSFYRCRDALYIVLPQNLTSIEQNTFSGCYNIKHCLIPDRCTTLGVNAFATSGIIDVIVIPSSVTTIAGIFLSLFKSYTWNKDFYCDLTNAGIGTFSALQLDKFIFNSTTTSLPSFSSEHCIPVFICESSQPPTAQSGAFRTEFLNDFIIYVPYSSDHSILNAYQNATNWTLYADKMVEYGG